MFCIYSQQLEGYFLLFTLPAYFSDLILLITFFFKVTMLDTVIDGQMGTRTPVLAQ